MTLESVARTNNNPTAKLSAIGACERAFTSWWAGRARFSIPIARTVTGEVVRERIASNLAPSGREVDLSARWRQRLDMGGELRLGAHLSIEPGHRADAGPDLNLLAGYRLTF